MKKAIALLLALALCIGMSSICFAAEEEPEQVVITPDNWQEYLQIKPEYTDKVDTCELTEIQGSITFKPTPKLDDAVEVPITLENWSSFFEIAEERNEQKNAFGNVEFVGITYYIDVREEYADHVVPTDNTVAFQVTADHVMNVFVDNQSNSWPSDSTAAYNPAKPDDHRANRLDQLYGGEQYAPDGTLEAQEYDENITVTRVEGSLFLAGVDPEELEAAMHPPKEYAKLAVGSSGDGVIALQQALIDQGFLTGAADGGYGDGTAAAVAAFQESVGLEATGTADSETQRLLFVDTAPAAPAAPVEDEPAAPAEDEPAAPAAESAPVEITMDNWDQYFEIASIQQEEKNAFGEVEAVNTTYAFMLKDEYVDRLDVEEENALAVEINYDWGSKSMGLLNASNDYAVNFSSDFADLYGYHYGVNVGMRGTSDIVVENITVTRIQGTIYLAP